jgi:hypothetical protein
MADSTGTTVAIVLGVIAGVLLIFVILYYVMKIRRRPIGGNYAPSFVDQNKKNENENGRPIFTSSVQDEPDYEYGVSRDIFY